MWILLKGFNEYKTILSDVAEPSRINDNFQKTLEDYMYIEEVKKLADTFE